MRRSWPLWWSETVEAARGPVPAVVWVCKCTSTLTQTQRDPQQYIFHLAKSLLKMSASKQAKNVVRIYWQFISLAEGFSWRKPKYNICKFICSSLQKPKRLLGRSLLHFLFSDGTIMHDLSCRNFTCLHKSFWSGIWWPFILVSSITRVQHRR